MEDETIEIDCFLPVLFFCFFCYNDLAYHMGILNARFGNDLWRIDLDG